MFNKLMQVILVTTSISPILITFWFKAFRENWKFKEGIIFLFLAILLIIILKLMLYLAQKKLEEFHVTITEISNSDYESIIFIFTYLIPLLNLDISMIIFLIALFYLIIFTTNIYHFNPFLGLLGYHQYQIKLEMGVTFILITKKQLKNTNMIKSVVQLSDYVLLEK